jgi:hypothetical protein
MKRLFIPSLFLLLGVVVLFGYYRMRTEHDRLLKTEADLLQTETVHRFQMNDNEFTIDGKKTVVDFVNADTANVEVKRDNSFKINDNHLYATFLVTIKGEQPVLLTKESYAKIQTGMTYPQVGELLGGSMEKGRLSAGFHGRLDLDQGKRQITLSFEDGKVTEKSAKDLE